MNGDAFQRARPGDKLKIPAAAWNACLDAAEAHKRGRPGNGGHTQFRQADIVFVKNTSGSNAPRFGVLGIDGVIITPSDSLSEFQNQVAFRGITPTTAAHAGKFVVCLDPIADGHIGRAWVSGVCHVQVNIQDSADTHCDVKNNDRTMLQSGRSGPARILFRESAGAGTKWCVVRLGDAYVDVLRICKTTTKWTKDTEATLDVWEAGDPATPAQNDPDESVTAVNLFHDVDEGVFVAVAMAKNGRWYLVEAGNADTEGCKKPVIAGDDLTTLPDYDATKTQLLGHESGCLKWFTTTDCSQGTPP